MGQSVSQSVGQSVGQWVIDSFRFGERFANLFWDICSTNFGIKTESVSRARGWYTGKTDKIILTSSRQWLVQKWKLLLNKRFLLGSFSLAKFGIAPTKDVTHYNEHKNVLPCICISSPTEWIWLQKKAKVLRLYRCNLGAKRWQWKKDHKIAKRSHGVNDHSLHLTIFDHILHFSQYTNEW